MIKADFVGGPYAGETRVLPQSTAPLDVLIARPAEGRGTYALVGKGEFGKVRYEWQGWVQR